MMNAFPALSKLITLFNWKKWIINNSHFLNDLEYWYGDIFYIRLHWVSLGQMLKCIHDFSQEINYFWTRRRCCFLCSVITPGCVPLCHALTSLCTLINWSSTYREWTICDLNVWQNNSFQEKSSNVETEFWKHIWFEQFFYKTKLARLNP
jgi:hypothetical protein